MLRCRLMGHRYRFSARDSTMYWACQRCGEGGSKRYRTPADAERYARAFDREDREDLGKRAPLISGIPLRLYRLVRNRRSRTR